MTYLLLHVLQAELQKLFELVDEKLEYRAVVRDAEAQPLSIIKQLFTGNIAQMTCMLEHLEAKYQDCIYCVHFDGGSQRSGHYICVVMTPAGGRWFCVLTRS